MQLSFRPNGARNEVAVEVVAGPAAVAERAADVTRALAAARIAEARQFCIALTGGETHRLYLEMLATRHRNEIDWSSVMVFFADDRCAPADDRASHFAQAEDALLSRVPLPRGNVHRVHGEDGDHARVATAYAAALMRVAGPVPVLDLVLLGVGEDGHAAGLFPRDLAGPGRDAPVRPEGPVIPVELPAAGPGGRWISLSHATIARARQVLVLANGAEVAPRLRECLREEGMLPLQRIVRERQGRTLFLIDPSAAGELQLSLAS